MPTTKPQKVAKDQEEQRSERQAAAALAGILDMVARLRHSQECTGEDCTLDTATIKRGLNLYYEKGDSKYGKCAIDEERAEYHNAEDAEQVIHEDPLCVEVRSGWTRLGEPLTPAQYTILLGTGGPACRIIGSLDEYGEPESATIEHQDWFTPWTEYLLDQEEEEAVVDYARCFYFGR
jgi:hypothetical protein